jgi:internalin A
MPEDSKEIFISYNWEDDIEFVERLDQAFSEKGVNLIRDIRAIPYKGLINEFMERIGRGKCIVVVLSDEYLKSPYCMFELVQIGYWYRVIKARKSYGVRV